uniref:Uncharacterized protein n=1 Tax=Photinus pyralis TaxID=7054 RepID=A0A1Y1L6I1_PHOPY
MSSEAEDTETFNEEETQATTSFGKSQAQQTPVWWILHYKCPLIELVRQQIRSVGDYELPPLDTDTTRPNVQETSGEHTSTTSATHPAQILAFVLLLISTAITFIYGAFKGAEICSGAPGKCNICYSVDSDIFKIPGLMTFHKSKSPF